MANQSKDELEEVTLSEGMDREDNSAEPRVYELAFHLDPELPQEEVKKAFQGIRETIEKAGTIIAEGEPLKIPLAYTISRQETTGRRDFDSSYFAWIAYEADGKGHSSVADMAREDKRIVRYLDLKTSKEVAKHSAEMHELFAKGADTEAGVPEDDAVAASDVELDAALKEAGV